MRIPLSITGSCPCKIWDTSSLYGILNEFTKAGISSPEIQKDTNTSFFLEGLQEVSFFLTKEIHYPVNIHVTYIIYFTRKKEIYKERKRWDYHLHLFE
jgi:hypothetical protein